jgi:hypothetical protein
MRFPGIIPAVTTPFTENDAVDVEALQENVEALLRAGVHGLVATGTMGESASLDLDERHLIVRSISEAAAGKVPVLGGIAAPTARIGTRYALTARDAGATALMVLPPLNYAGDFREISGYYRAIGDCCGLPIMAYNNPGASGVELSVATTLRWRDSAPARRAGSQGWPTWSRVNACASMRPAGRAIWPPRVACTSECSRWPGSTSTPSSSSTSRRRWIRSDSTAGDHESRGCR